MGYGRALLQRDVKLEEEDLQSRAKKKGLWGSIGRTVGSLGIMAVTGGTVNPVTLGLLTGGASFLGGAVGAKFSKTGDLSKGRFFKEDRAELQKELGAFGTQNITASLKSGIQAGVGQAAKLYKAGSRAQELGGTAEEVSKIRKGVGFKESFKESMVGKGWDKYVTQPGLVKEAGEQARFAENLQERSNLGREFGEGGGAKRGLERMAVSRPDAYYSGDQPTLQDIREYGTTPTEPISAFTQKMPSIPEEQIGGVDPLGLKRMRVAEDMPEFTTQMPTDPSFEFGAGGGRSELSDMLQESLGVRNRLGLGAANIYNNKYGRK